METPTPCPNCGVICKFDDMVNHPNEFTALVCEDCYESIEQDNNCGFTMDNFNNKISWQAYPDDGLIEISVNGEELAAWGFEDDAEGAFSSFMEIWGKAQACTHVAPK